MNEDCSSDHLILGEFNGNFWLQTLVSWQIWAQMWQYYCLLLSLHLLSLPSTVGEILDFSFLWGSAKVWRCSLEMTSCVFLPTTVLFKHIWFGETPADFQVGLCRTEIKVFFPKVILRWTAGQECGATLSGSKRCSQRVLISVSAW